MALLGRNDGRDLLEHTWGGLVHIGTRAGCRSAKVVVDGWAGSADSGGVGGLRLLRACIERDAPFCLVHWIEISVDCEEG